MNRIEVNAIVEVPLNDFTLVQGRVVRIARPEALYREEQDPLDLAFNNPFTRRTIYVKVEIELEDIRLFDRSVPAVVETADGDQPGGGDMATHERWSD